MGFEFEPVQGKGFKATVTCDGCLKPVSKEALVVIGTVEEKDDGLLVSSDPGGPWVACDSECARTVLGDLGADDGTPFFARLDEYLAELCLRLGVAPTSIVAEKLVRGGMQLSD